MKAINGLKRITFALPRSGLEGNSSFVKQKTITVNVCGFRFAVGKMKPNRSVHQNIISTIEELNPWGLH